MFGCPIELSFEDCIPGKFRVQAKPNQEVTYNELITSLFLLILSLFWYYLCDLSGFGVMGMQRSYSYRYRRKEYIDVILSFNLIIPTDISHAILPLKQQSIREGLKDEFSILCI